VILAITITKQDYRQQDDYSDSFIEFRRRPFVDQRARLQIIISFITRDSDDSLSRGKAHRAKDKCTFHVRVRD